MGSRVAILSETRLMTRTGTAAAVKVVMARARLACLPVGHPAAIAAKVANDSGEQQPGWLIPK